MKICLIAYKIDPELGSEDASGFHLVKEISKHYNVTLISRRNNIAKLQDHPDFKNIHLIGLDVPGFLAFFKKKNRGIILYYYLWQLFVGHKVKNLHKQKPFDIIHQINFHGDWPPHFLYGTNAQTIWGPIAHHPMTPYSWFPRGFRLYYLKEILFQTVKLAFWNLNPFLRKAIKKTDRIIFANENIPAPYLTEPDKIIRQTYGGSHWPVQIRQHDKRHFNLLFTGRMIALKGPHLALDAFQYFLKNGDFKRGYKPHFTLIGSGPLDPVIRQKTALLNHRYGHVVTLHHWMDREALQQHYSHADFFLYPSLESQGLVVSEAISQNCAAITLAGTGPAFIAQDPSLTVQSDISDYHETVRLLGEKLISLHILKHHNPAAYQEIFDKTEQRAEMLRWPVIAREIMKTYTA